MKRFVTALLTVCLMISLCACFAAPQNTMPTEEMMPQVLMEGYVTGEAMNIMDNPLEDGGVVGFYLPGAYVQIYEIDGAWGRTDEGWILWDQLSAQPADNTESGSGDSTVPQNGNANQNTPTQNTAQTEATVATEATTGGAGNNTQLPPSDNNQAILGDWYVIGEGYDGGYNISLIDFSSDGYHNREGWTVYSSNWDQRIPSGGFGYYYATVGSTIYLLADMSGIPDDDVPKVSSSSFSVSGNTLTIWGATYSRGGYDDALAQVKAMYGPKEDTTTDTTQTPAPETSP